MGKSVTSNYIYHLIDTVTSTLFPLITFPYAARVMLADGIGLVNFYNSIISYIILIVGLGIPLYAVRETARVRNNEQELNSTTLEILSLHMMLTILGYAVILVLCCTVDEIQANIPLFLILSLSILFTTFGCNWFYQGIEDFQYITIRAIAVRLISIVFLFTIVKTREDLLWYGVYMVIGTIGNNLFNILRLRKYTTVSIDVIRHLRPFRHLRFVSKMFVFTAIATIYLQLNTVFLGFVCNVESVGYYTSGLKLYTVVFGIVASLTTILIPRLSNLVSQNELERFAELSQKSYRVIISLSMPLAVGLFAVSPYAVILLCGNAFEPAVSVSRIVSPLLIIVGLSNLIGMQILYSLGHINILIKAALYSSIVDVIVLVITSQYAENGAAISYLCAEITALAVEYRLGRQYIPIKFKDKSIIVYIVASAVMFVALYALSLFSLSNVSMTLVMLTVGILVYSSFMIYYKDTLYWELLQKIIRRIR